jgi:hypothetical protein
MMSNERLNYWRLLVAEHEREVEEATRESDIPRAIRATMQMAHAMEQARITNEREE